MAAARAAQEHAQGELRAAREAEHQSVQQGRQLQQGVEAAQASAAEREDEVALALTLTLTPTLTLNLTLTLTLTLT